MNVLKSKKAKKPAPDFPSDIFQRTPSYLEDSNPTTTSQPLPFPFLYFNRLTTFGSYQNKQRHTTPHTFNLPYPIPFPFSFPHPPPLSTTRSKINFARIQYASSPPTPPYDKYPNALFSKYLSSQSPKSKVAIIFRLPCAEPFDP